jgi:L-ribulose-5-phosphate 3-epimerase
MTAWAKRRRRGGLALGALAGAPLGLFLAFASGEAAAGKAVPLCIKLGVCDWTLEKSGDPRALEAAARLGLEGVQVSLNVRDGSLALSDKKIQEAYINAVKKTGLEIASFALGDLNSFPLQSDPRAEKWIAESIAVSAAMNTKVILVPFFGKADLRNDAPGTGAVIRALKRLAPRAEKAGVILGLESWLSAEDHLKIIEHVGSPAVRVYYDVGNAQEAGYDISAEIQLLGRQICEVHAKDYKDLYGKGSMDFQAVRRALEDINYSGWLVIEGTKAPLGIEQSIRYDRDYLRTIFPAAPAK